ncbi:hypothetical protein V8C42DRAFT_316582 [Trichoderma barbatum]
MIASRNFSSLCNGVIFLLVLFLLFFAFKQLTLIFQGLSWVLADSACLPFYLYLTLTLPTFYLLLSNLDLLFTLGWRGHGEIYVL